MGCCDCSRTLTTSRGVTFRCSFVVSFRSLHLEIEKGYVPSKDVRMLPETADSILCEIEMLSFSPLSSVATVETGDEPIEAF